ncbi:MAG: acylphosphatase [Gammaproteobacteria bacterium WSBS_2016_MAG_OTU1]
MMTQEQDNVELISAEKIKYRLTGEVQNIGFRNYIAEAAEQLQVNGWAKNETDGSLIILLQGVPEALSQIIPLVQQGPSGAVVSNIVELMVEEEDIAINGFETR